MWRVGFCLLLLNCTKPNPNNCESGVCSDPAMPYCDVSGAISGTPKTCVAVSCTANAFEACDGDSAITCNASGDNYSSQQCSNGCDATIGCRVCAAGQTVCANGQVQTCDATGAVTSATTCPLGCFEDQPRCRDIDPSNGLAKYLDMVADPPDLDLPDGTRIFTDGGAIQVPSGSPVTVPSFLIDAPTNGVAVRVYVVRSAKLGNVSFAPSVIRATSTAFAFVASGDIAIAGTLKLDQAGDFRSKTCNGGSSSIGASGGGGFATTGGKGGIGVSGGGIAAGGAISGNGLLVPLRGGCGSGDPQAAAPSDEPGVYGGSAIQLVSRTKIHLLAHARIDVDGESGFGFLGGDGYPTGQPTGGGAGGAVLIEAPDVQFDDDARILANGGPGAAGDNEGFTEAPESDTLDAAPGELCAHPSTNCGSGGSGAALGSPAGDGGAGNVGPHYGGGGGGGGGLGRIRINTKDGTYAKVSSAIVAGDISTGTVSTR